MSTELGPARPSAASDADLAALVGDATRRLELDDPDRNLPLVDRVVNRAVEILGVGLLAGMFAIIFVNAVTRYVLNYSLIWGEEVVIGLVPWLAVTGLFLSMRRRQMIEIEFFLETFPPTTGRVIAIVGDLLGAVMLAWLAWLGFTYVSTFGGDPTPYLGLPKGLFTSALWLGPAAVAVAFLVAAWQERRRQW